MAYDFAVDSNITEDVVIAKLNQAADEIETKIGEIFSLIDGMNESWSGESYDLFKAKCTEYRPALEGLVIMLEAFSKIFSDNILPAIETLKVDVDSAFDKFGG